MSFTGRKHSEETKEKMRQAKLKNPTRYWEGKKMSVALCEKISKGRKGVTPNRDYTVPDERKKKISETLKKKHASGELISPLRTLGLIGRTGKDAMNWQGGKTLIGQNIRRSDKYRRFRYGVLARDGYKCVECGSEENLQVDHIKPFSLFPELRFSYDNARTLCKPCHLLTDTWGARTKQHAICK